MKTTFVCLANSKKEGGRCLAGVELLDGNPVIMNDKFKWIRPVCKTEHGQVPTYLVNKINLLDIIEMEETEKIPEGYQTENILFDTRYIKVIDAFSPARLPELCTNSLPVLFGNKGKAVSIDSVHLLNHSLCMISVKEFYPYWKEYESKSQIRLGFEHNSVEYDFPVTDPVFEHNFKANKRFISGRTEIHLTLSLAIVQNGWHSKLVAAIL